MHKRGLRADESYWALLVVGAGSGGGGGVGATSAGGRLRARGLGVGGGAAARGVGAGAWAAGDRMRSAATRLTLEIVVAGGPTGGATAVPTLMRSASGLPVFNTGAVAVVGTV